MKSATRSLALLLGLCLAAIASTEQVRDLSWDELIPAEERDLPTPVPAEPVDPFGGSMASQQSLAGSIVTELDGQEVRLPGFVVPLESDEGGLLAEFFLVPYFGACIHVPPPPPNQLVYVKLQAPYELTSMWDPFWISGTLRARGFESDMGLAGYTLEQASVAPYEWPE